MGVKEAPEAGRGREDTQGYRVTSKFTSQLGSHVATFVAATVPAKLTEPVVLPVMVMVTLPPATRSPKAQAPRLSDRVHSGRSAAHATSWGSIAKSNATPVASTPPVLVIVTTMVTTPVSVVALVSTLRVGGIYGKARQGAEGGEG